MLPCGPLMCFGGTGLLGRSCRVLPGDCSGTGTQELRGATPALGLVDLHSLCSFIKNFSWDIFRLLKLLL